ncbi:MAG: hypothetical protein HFJ25_00830 [Clostridia bacterium]|nr:hypothetical protein [Clostridia bacterium]
MKLYKHFVITRFNIRIHYGCKLKNPEDNPMDRILDEDYLEERFYIFEKYTFPSMKNQNNKDFTWIILFHKKTPDKFKKRIERLKHEFNFVDLYLDDGEKFSFLEYCDNYEKDIEYFLTTRIDNDDMINEEYISKIQEYADKNFHQCVISFEKGIKYDLYSQKKFEYIRKDNHFLSMIGPREECILQYNHAKILDSGKEMVFLNSDLYMWTEIIHDSNVINKVKKEDTENEI